MEDGDGRPLVGGDQVQVASVVVARVAVGGAVGAWGANEGSPVLDRVLECLQVLAFGPHRGRDAPVLITGDVVKRGCGAAARSGGVGGVVAAGH